MNYLFRLHFSCALLLPALASLIISATTTFANIPGGFTALVTTPVTTGTETYGANTDHFLDNGILHVSISPNGSVDSIKYLKPGSAGTPAANGTETVSQSGVNFGNHTAIYYYWYPDGNGDCVYSGTTTGSTNIDITYLRTFNPSVDKVVCDVELHYVLGKGNTGLYGYLVVRHPASYVNYPTNLAISFIQVLWPTAHDNTNFLCENGYIDDGVKYGLTLSGVHQKRNGLLPNFYDGWHTIAVTNINIPKEVVQFTTGLFAGSTNGKYSGTFDYPKLSTWGTASDVNQIGQWFVMGGHEYQNNGPMACEYTTGSLITFEPLIAHYGNTGLTVSSNAAFSMIYGPWLFYFNSLSNGLAAWVDSKQQALTEQQAWPYSWLTNSVYQSKNQRASISGKLVINDSLRPQATAAGAWIGFAAPDASVENDPNNWQWQSDGYQFWTQCAADGSFTLPPVTTFTPYGSNAVYQLYAYCAGTNGSVGEFNGGTFTFAPGMVTNLGSLTWNVPHQGNSLAWEIGYPDRTAGKFRHGDDYSVPGLWLGFANEFPNPMTYTVGVSSPTNDWNYAQTAYFTNSVANNMVWNIQFVLTNLPVSGNLTLNTVWAGAYSAAIQVFVNTNTSGPVFRDFYPNIPFPSGVHADSLIRQGIHDKYGIDHTPIPASKFVVGTNTITLVQRRAASATVSYVMYDYLSLELPTPIAPPNLSAAPGNSKVTLNWQSAPGATGYALQRSTNNGATFTLLASLATTNYTDTATLNGTNYYYVVAATNSSGASGNSLPASAHPVSTNAPTLNFSTSTGQLNFSWPADHLGWRLQTQTNARNTGLGTNWMTLEGSTNTTNVILPVSTANASVFFRLVYP